MAQSKIPTAARSESARDTPSAESVFFSCIIVTGPPVRFCARQKEDPIVPPGLRACLATGCAPIGRGRLSGGGGGRGDASQRSRQVEAPKFRKSWGPQRSRDSR